MPNVWRCPHRLHFNLEADPSHADLAAMLTAIALNKHNAHAFSTWLCLVRQQVCHLRMAAAQHRRARRAPHARLLLLLIRFNAM